MTVQTGTRPARYFFAPGTWQGGMQTEAQPYLTASSQRRRISSLPASVRSRVWSQRESISESSILSFSFRRRGDIILLRARIYKPEAEYAVMNRGERRGASAASARQT